MADADNLWSIKVCEYSRSRSFHDDLILQDQASGERSRDHWSSCLISLFNMSAAYKTAIESANAISWTSLRVFKNRCTVQMLFMASTGYVCLADFGIAKTDIKHIFTIKT